MNLIKKLIIICFMLMFSSFIFASTSCSNMSTTECDVCVSSDEYNTPIPNTEIFMSDCLIDCDFNLISTTSNTLFLQDKDLVFKTNDKCGLKKVNVNVLVYIDFKLSSSTIGNTLYIKNANPENKIDSLTLIEKKITFNSTSTSNASPGILDISDINLIRLTRTLSIDVNEDTKSKCVAQNDWTIYYGVQLNFNNIEIAVDSNSFIQVKSAKTYQGVSNDSYCLYLTRGYPAILVGQSIVNNSNDFNLSIIGGDSADGYSPTGNGTKDDVLDAGTPNSGGSSTLILNYLENNGNLNLEIKSGFGGNGGVGQESCDKDSCKQAPVGDGGWGGTGGHVFYKLNNLKNNVDGNLNVNLITGNGGNGGLTGFDHGGHNFTKDYAAAGSGRDGGNVYFGLLLNWPDINYSNLDLIYNKGILNFNVTPGKGGNGGTKYNHGCGCDDFPDCASGKDGSGGNGGNVYDLNVNFIYNNSDDMNLTLTSGNKGFKTGCLENPVDGKDGNVNKIIIDYLDNKKEDSISINSFNSKNSITSNDFIVNYLRPNSFLPSTIHLLRKENIEDSKININGCFIGAKGLNQYDFYAHNLNLNVLNMSSDVVNSINFYGIQDFNYEAPTNLTCNYCDLDEPSSKIAGSYSIYSTIDGNINANDLNIYYYASTTGNKLGLVNPIYSGYPLYRNKAKINGVFDSKTGLYQYVIKPENLFWYDNPEYILNKSLDKESKPYCTGQQYYIEGKIEGTSFGFPFTPIFKQW
ncbi:MAG: hypothetical protein WCF78_03345 [archaeon]